MLYHSGILKENLWLFKHHLNVLLQHLLVSVTFHFGAAVIVRCDAGTEVVAVIVRQTCKQLTDSSYTPVRECIAIGQVVCVL